MASRRTIPRRDYGKLQDTHEEVAGQKAATEPQNAPSRVQAFLAAERQQRQAQAPTGQAERTEAAELQQPADQRAESHTTRNADRVEEFLNAENLSREAKKAILQELGRAAGREVTIGRQGDHPRPKRGAISLAVKIGIRIKPFGEAGFGIDRSGTAQRHHARFDKADGFAAIQAGPMSSGLISGMA